MSAGSNQRDQVITQRPKLKIAIFHFGFFYSGGGEKLVLEEIRGLRNLGHEVTCFAPYVDRAGCFPDYPEIAEVKRLLPHPPSWLPLNHAIWVLACCLLIPFMALRFVSFDVLFGANQPAPWFAFVLSRLLKKPYVVYLAQPLRLLHPRKVDEENGLRIQDGDQQFVKLVTKYAGLIIDAADRLSVRQADAVLTNGQHVDEWIRQAYGVRSIACAAGCHPARQEALNYERRRVGTIMIGGSSISKPFILLSNRHSPMKRFEYALWAMKAIVRELGSASLVITGQETEYTSQLKYLVQGLGLEKSVTFIGLVSETDLCRLYSEACLYVYTSPEEDFGMGIIEAMAAGTPVVAWNAAGPTETIQHGVTGLLARAYDTDEFSENMLSLLRGPELAERMGLRGHARAKRLFSYERHNRLIERVLQAAVANAARRMTTQLDSGNLEKAYALGEIHPENEEPRIIDH